MSGQRSFGGHLSKEGCSMLDLSTVFLFVMMAFLSLERVFGGLRFFESSVFTLLMVF